MSKIDSHKMNEEALKLFRALIDQSNDSIEVVDPDTGSFLDANENAWRELGYTREEFLKLTPFEIDPAISHSAFQNIMDEAKLKGFVIFESVHKRKDGTEFPVEINLKFIQLDKSYVVTVVRNITERKLAENTLTTSETRYRRLFETAKDGILILNAVTGKIIDVNPFLIEKLGYSREQFIEKEIWEIGFFKDIVANYDMFIELQKKEYVRYDDLPLKTAYGHRIDVEFVSNVYSVDHHKVIQCNIRDITERKLAEEALKVSEEKFRLVFNKSRDAIFIHHINGNFIDVNQMACESLEYSHEELLKMGPADIDDPENAKNVNERTLQVSNKKFHYFETTQVSKSGKFIYVEVNSVLIDYFGEPAILSIARDISERKKLSEELERNMDIQKVINILLKLALDDIPLKDLFSKALELIVSIPWLAVEKKGAIFLTNENGVLDMQAAFGLNKDVLDACKTVTSGKCICGLVLSTKMPVYTAELDDRHDINYPGMDDHGHYCVPIMFSGEVLGVINTYLAKGHSFSILEIDFLKGVANALASIIVRRKAENELRILNEKLETRVIERTEELAKVNKQLKKELTQREIVELELSKNVKFLSLLIETIPNPIFYKDTKGVFIDCNKAFAELLSKPKKEIMGKTVHDLFPKEIANVYSEKDDELINNPGVQIYESRTNLNDKNFKDIITYKATFTDTDGSVAGLVGVIIGIARAKLVEEEIKANLEKEKELNLLKSRFIAVVSHEFRTPLAGIQSSIQLLERYGHKWDDTKKQDIYHDIYKSIRYTNMLLDDVSLIGKDESGKVTFTPSLSKIEEICLRSIESVKAIHQDAASINFSIIPESILAIIDESLLRHILNNILSNSVKYSVPGSIVDFTVRIESGNIVFTVSDYGIGIPENDLEHIYETFHRASNVDTIKGTGLGLAIVKRCVELHEGTIKIESKLNIGTTITVKIPYIEKKSDIA